MNKQTVLFFVFTQTNKRTLTLTNTLIPLIPVTPISPLSPFQPGSPSFPGKPWKTKQQSYPTHSAKPSKLHTENLYFHGDKYNRPIHRALQVDRRHPAGRRQSVIYAKILATPI